MYIYGIEFLQDTVPDCNGYLRVKFDFENKLF